MACPNPFPYRWTVAVKFHNEFIVFLMTCRSFVKTQKGLSSDIARGSVKPLHKVQEDTESLKQMLAGLTSGFQRNVALADKLKADTAKVMGLFCIVMALGESLIALCKTLYCVCVHSTKVYTGCFTTLGHNCRR